MPRVFSLIAISSAIACSGAVAAENGAYEQTIQPLLMEKCAACHGALKQEGGLRLDASQLIRQGGDSGSVIAAGEPDESLIYERVAADDEFTRMPPEGEGEAFDEEQLAALRNWILDGAPSPVEETVPADPRLHWAYQSPQRTTPPAASSGEVHRNPIDAFLSASQEEQGVVPVGRADKATLLRRVYFDLVGLPPTPEQLRSFLTDNSEDAYPRVVDDLLASPRHGERWARHWMDVWRYSDWDGYKEQLRGSQRHIWRWRDWIIESLNQDKGYDRMVREMLAGDEIAPTDEEVLRATGFLARNYHTSNRNIWLDATVEHTAKAFLGLTIDCARCHDHKFDPVAQTDYYRMRAIFEPHNVRVERLPGNADTLTQGLVRAFDAELETPTYLYVAGDEKRPDESEPLTPGVPQVLGDFPDPTPVDLPLRAWLPHERAFIEKEDLAARERDVVAAKEALDALRATDSISGNSTSDSITDNGDQKPSAPLAIESAQLKLRVAEASLASLTARLAADDAKFVAHSDEAPKLAAEAARLERLFNLREAEAALLAAQQSVISALEVSDEAKREPRLKAVTERRAAAEKALVEARAASLVSDGKYTPVGKAYPKTSTGRRTALAEWITDERNPLTARVAVNHVWLRHFGEPLVENTYDFGLRSPRPRHAELLDWLAVELMESGWSFKRLHRLIVTSDAYQRSSTVTGVAAHSSELDPENTLFWRANVQRLEAEVVRDSVLAVSGSLDLTVGGPDIPHGKGESIPRRSIYFQHAYEKQMQMLVLFDAANPTDCYRRIESIVPQQALTLANSVLTLNESRKLARQLSDRTETDGAFVVAAFEQILSRSPTSEESEKCRAFLSRQASLLEQPEHLSAFESPQKASTPPSDSPDLRAKENLVHVLLNHNDFVTVR